MNPFNIWEAIGKRFKKNCYDQENEVIENDDEIDRQTEY